MSKSFVDFYLLYIKLEGVTNFITYINYEALSDIRPPIFYLNECALTQNFSIIAQSDLSPTVFKVVAVKYVGRFSQFVFKKK